MNDYAYIVENELKPLLYDIKQYILENLEDFVIPNDSRETKTNISNFTLSAVESKLSELGQLLDEDMIDSTSQIIDNSKNKFNKFRTSSLGKTAKYAVGTYAAYKLAQYAKRKFDNALAPSEEEQEKMNRFNASQRFIKDLKQGKLSYNDYSRYNSGQHLGSSPTGSY